MVGEPYLTPLLKCTKNLFTPSVKILFLEETLMNYVSNRSNCKKAFCHYGPYIQMNYVPIEKLGLT